MITGLDSRQITAIHVIKRQFFILTLFIGITLAGCVPGTPGSPGITASRTPFQPIAFTPTAFQPAPPTANTSKKFPQPARATQATSPAVPRDFYSIDFGKDDQRVTIEITPRSQAVNRGKPILISFIPGEICTFGDQRGCVYSYRAKSGATILHVSVHSGVGGEAQALRHALEGTGINQAAFSLSQIQSNLRSLEGSTVRITQGERTVKGLILTHAGRVTAQKIEGYFRAPLHQALATAAAIDPSLLPAVNPPVPQLVIETCGWKSREEPWAAGVTSTTASIYLGIIRKGP